MSIFQRIKKAFEHAGFLGGSRYDRLRDRLFTGHVRIGPVVIYGANAMHYAVNIRTSEGYVCAAPTTGRKGFVRRCTVLFAFEGQGGVMSGIGEPMTTTAEEIARELAGCGRDVLIAMIARAKNANAALAEQVHVLNREAMMAIDHGVERGKQLERRVVYERLRRAGYHSVVAAFEAEDKASS